MIFTPWDELTSIQNYYYTETYCMEIFMQYVVWASTSHGNWPYIIISEFSYLRCMGLQLHICTACIIHREMKYH